MNKEEKCIKVRKRNGQLENFNQEKIKNAITAAFNSIGYSIDEETGGHWNQCGYQGPNQHI